MNLKIKTNFKHVGISRFLDILKETNCMNGVVRGIGYLCNIFLL